MPMATFSGEFLHSSLPSMAAAYLFHICQNHTFVDGNKRTGANAAITFLLINDWELDVSEDELVDLVLSVASGTASKSAVTETFEARCRPASDPRRGLAQHPVWPPRSGQAQSLYRLHCGLADYYVFRFHLWRCRRAETNELLQPATVALPNQQRAITAIQDGQRCRSPNGDLPAPLRPRQRGHQT